MARVGVEYNQHDYSSLRVDTSYTFVDTSYTFVETTSFDTSYTSTETSPEIRRYELSSNGILTVMDDINIRDFDLRSEMSPVRINPQVALFFGENVTFDGHDVSGQIVCNLQDEIMEMYWHRGHLELYAIEPLGDNLFNALYDDAEI